MSHSGRAAYATQYEPEALTTAQRAFAEQGMPERDGRCFVETPPSVATAIRQYQTADYAWRKAVFANTPYHERHQLFGSLTEAERECCRVMDDHQGVHARLAGFYECDGAWVGFDRVHSGGMELTVMRTRPVFASKCGK